MRSHLIIFVILGTLTFLTFPGQSDGDVINACKNDRNGILRVVDDAADCRGSETPLSWNTEGPQGEQGEQGPPGPPGGFDVNRLYVVTCEDSIYCQCEDRGGRHFISGTVVCDMTVIATQTSLHVTNYHEGIETFEAVCTSAQIEPPIASYHTPQSINLICYDDSE
jgi:hypothetical protein